MKELNLTLTFPKELKEMMSMPDIRLREKPFYNGFLNKRRKRK